MKWADLLKTVAAQVMRIDCGLAQITHDLSEVVAALRNHVLVNGETCFTIRMLDGAGNTKTCNMNSLRHVRRWVASREGAKGKG